MTRMQTYNIFPGNTKDQRNFQVQNIEINFWASPR